MTVRKPSQEGAPRNSWKPWKSRENGHSSSGYEPVEDDEI